MTIDQYCLDDGLAPNRRQDKSSNIVDTDIWRNMESLIHNELFHCPLQNFTVNIKLLLVIEILRASCEIALNSMRQDPTDPLTHWGRVTHICGSRLTITGSDNGLSPGRRQAIIWTNAGILLIGTLEINFSEILIEIHPLSLKKNAFECVVCEMAVILLGLDVLTMTQVVT